MSFVLVISMVAFSPMMGITRSEAKSHRLKMYALPTVKNIKIIINKGKKVSYYKIYRAKVSKKSLNKFYEHAGCKNIPMKDFKFIKKTKKPSYTDKRVNKNNYYGYYVKGFSKKGKCVDKYINRDWDECLRHIGKLDTPTLITGPDDNITGHTGSTSKKLNMYMETRFGGPVAKYCILYRKAEGTKKYKKIKKIKIDLDKERDQIWKRISDKTVKAGKKYYYKVKLYYKANNKKYYSKVSSPLKMWAVDDKPKYNVECMTSPFTWDCKKNPNGKHDFVLRITDKKCNGKTILTNDNSSYNCVHDYYAFEGQACDYDIVEYSYDNKNWIKMTDKGFVLSKKKDVYVKYILTPDEMQKEKIIKFGGASKDSKLICHNFGYCGVRMEYFPLVGYLYLKSGKGLFDLDGEIDWEG